MLAASIHSPDAVKVTLGPKGRNVVLDISSARRGSPRTAWHGEGDRSFPDSLENMGAQMIKEVASKTDLRGDG